MSIYSSPSWKIGTSTRDDEEKLRMKTSNYPPPDSYNPSYKNIKERNASWSFGRSKRNELATTSKDTPAPGTYSTEKKVAEGPKYHLGLKLDNLSSIG